MMALQVVSGYKLTIVVMTIYASDLRQDADHGHDYYTGEPRQEADRCVDYAGDKRPYKLAVVVITVQVTRDY